MEHVRKYRFLITAVIFCVLYLRSLSWGWLGLDDTVILGPLVEGFGADWLGQGEVKRFLPVFWLLAWVTAPCGVVGFHALTLAISFALVVSVQWILEQEATHLRALALVSIWQVSPLRLEVFGWSIGFLYAVTALAVVWSWWAYRDSRYVLSLVVAGLAVLVYPVAAGYALLLVWLRRRTAEGWMLGLWIFSLACLQYSLRVPEISEVHPDRAFWSLPFTLAVNFIPLASVPIVPSGQNWLAIVGSGAFAFWVAVSWRGALAFVVICLPVAMAAFSEPYWLGARYTLLPSLYLVWALRWVEVPPGRLALAGTALAAVTFMHRGFSSLDACIERAFVETRILCGRDAADRANQHIARGLVEQAQRKGI